MIVANILTNLDRMKNNPDADWVREVGKKVLRKKKIPIHVFVCPKFDTSALVSGSLSKYMPITAEGVDDLFLQRQRKIKTLLETLRNVGVAPELFIHVGDNDAEEYIFPYMEVRSPKGYKGRQKKYRASLQRRANRVFSGFDVKVVSLGVEGISRSSKQPGLDSKYIEQEVEFFGWLFGPEGPYKGNLKFSLKALKEMATRKFQLYGAQGKYLQGYGGVLLQTEGPGVWLLRTQMLRSTGAKAIPAIYPWIRRRK